MGIVLGMGVSPTAAYLMTVLIVAPLMVKSGVPVTVTHFFSLFYANMAFITPPVAIGAFVAADMAGADVWRVGITAVRLASVGFAVPFVFVHRPPLLLCEEPLEVIWAVFACAVLVLCLACAFEGWMLKRLSISLRVPILGAGLALIPPHPGANVAAAAAGGRHLRAATPVEPGWYRVAPSGRLRLRRGLATRCTSRLVGAMAAGCAASAAAGAAL